MNDHSEWAADQVRGMYEIVKYVSANPGTVTSFFTDKRVLFDEEVCPLSKPEYDKIRKLAWEQVEKTAAHVIRTHECGKATIEEVEEALRACSRHYFEHLPSTVRRRLIEATKHGGGQDGT